MIKINGNLDYIITSGCNLSCDDCDRFSNFNLPYTESLEEAEKNFEAWGKAIEVDTLTITGGEPLMHPHLNELIALARKYIKCNLISIITNGSLLHKPRNQRIMETLLENQPSHMLVSIHFSQGKERDTIIRNIKKYLIKDFEWKKQSRKVLKYQNVELKIDDFTDAQSYWIPYNRFENGVIKPHIDNNAQRSIERCGAQYTSAIFKNRLYKCPRTAVLRDFLEKYELSNDPDWYKYYTYKGCKSDETKKILQLKDLKGLPEYLCEMCPASGSGLSQKTSKFK
jgi:organic radical activating enzyme